MADDQIALKSLFAYNNMKPRFSYVKAPLIGYVPNQKRVKKINQRKWTIMNYQRKGFRYPFTQFILVNGAHHQTHASEASYTWNFLRHFARKK